MKIAFTRIGGRHWMGGQNYLVNLLSVISEYGEDDCECVVFLGEGTDQELADRISSISRVKVIQSPKFGGSGYYSLLRKMTSFLLQRDYIAESEFRRFEVDVVFQHQAWYGLRFGLPTVAWIADFQHRRLPSMFSRLKRTWRDMGYHALGNSATQIMVSSQDAGRDCEAYFRSTSGKIVAVPFAIKPPADSAGQFSLELNTTNYGLPDRFFFLPNQFWKHKNHLLVVDALALARTSVPDMVVAVTGLLADNRHPAYPETVMARVSSLGLEDNFVYLGKIAHGEVLALMSRAIATLNPSLFEGWSTTVEETKSLACKLLLSDIPIHREQAESFQAVFFDPNDAGDLAQKLISMWVSDDSDHESEFQRRSALKLAYEENRKLFARKFLAVCNAATEIQCERNRE